MLQGRFSALVEGNDYGSAVETYLVAPFLLFTDQYTALKLVPVVLALLSAVALGWTARPLLGSSISTMLGCIAWVVSGAVVIILSRNYMGYPSGFLSLIIAYGCAVRLMSEHSPKIAVIGGFAAGAALWGHPMFGVVAALAFLPVIAANLRRAKTLGLVVLGAFVALLPWVTHLLTSGLPKGIPYYLPSTYVERLGRFVTELVPSAVGLRTGAGEWLLPETFTKSIAVLILISSFAGLAVLLKRKGWRASPLFVAGIGAFPALATFQAMGYTLDGRYCLPFVPSLLIGLGALALLLPTRIVDHPATAMVVPVAWGILACVPAIHQQVGWQWGDPNTDARAMARELEARHINALRGSYWGVYVTDFFSGDRLSSLPDHPVRLSVDAGAARAASESSTAYVYEHGKVQSGKAKLARPLDQYVLEQVGPWDLWILGSK